MEKRRLQFILLLVVGAVVWSAFAWGYMPGVVERAYRGESISYFNNLLDYRHVNPLEFYMAKWYRLAGGLLALWLGAGVLLLATTTQRFARFIGSATPGTLGAMRVLVCLILIYSVWDAKTRTVASLLESQRRSMGVMDWIYAAPFGFDQLVRSDTGLVIFKGATILALALAAIGWKTRLLVPIAALLYLAHGGIIRSHYWFFHNGLIPWYVLAAMCFMRCGDGFSIDRILRVRRGKTVPPADVAVPYYAWCRYVCWILVIMPYVAAGMSKLGNGTIYWWHGVNMQSILYTQALLHPFTGADASFMLRHPELPTWFYSLLGIGTIFSEIGMILILVSHRARMILPAAAAALHLGIKYLMGIWFWDLVWIQLLFYNWRPVRIWAMNRLRRGGEIIANTVDHSAAAASGLRRFAGPVVVTLVPVFLLSLWARRVEYYPLTSMQMFSTYDNSGLVTYYRVYHTNETGETREAPLAEMGIGRPHYWGLLIDAFETDPGREKLVEILQHVGTSWNGVAEQGQRVVRFEVHKRQWDFVRSRLDQALGDTVEQFAVDLPATFAIEQDMGEDEQIIDELIDDLTEATDETWENT